MLLKIFVTIFISVVHLFLYSVVLVDHDQTFKGVGPLVLSALAGYVLFRCWDGKQLLHKVMRAMIIFLPIIFFVGIIPLLDLIV